MADFSKHFNLMQSTSAVDYSSTIITWDGETDPTRPMNWSPVRKWAIVVTTTLITFVVSFSSSVFSTTLSDVVAEFNSSETVAVLGISLFVFSFAFGSLMCVSPFPHAFRDTPETMLTSLQMGPSFRTVRKDSTTVDWTCWFSHLPTIDGQP